MSFLKIWGCEAYVKRLQGDKLHPKIDKCFFVGYPKQIQGYYFYNSEDNKMFVARDGVFLEKEFLSRKPSGSKVVLEEIRDEQQMDVDNTTSEARAHETINHASEQANSTSETPIVPLESNSCENLQKVGEKISTVAPTPRRSTRIRNK